MVKTKKILILLLCVCLLTVMTGCAFFRQISTEEIEAIAVGQFADGVYENPVFGIGCRLDSTWDLPTQQDLLTLNQWSADADQEEQLRKTLGKAGYFFDMTASADNERQMVNVCVENLAVLYDPDMTEDGYVEYYLENNQEAYEDFGCQELVLKPITVRFAGSEHPGYFVQCQVDGEAIYQKTVCIKSGLYMATATASSVGTDHTDEILSLFYSLSK